MAVMRTMKAMGQQVGAAALRTLASELVLRGLTVPFERVWARVDLVPGWLQRHHAAALFATLAATRPRSIVEIGSYLGKSTIFLALSAAELGIDATVSAIDPHTGDRQQLDALGLTEVPTYDLFVQHLASSGVGERVRVLRELSLDAANAWVGPIDFVYIDGWHEEAAVRADGLAWAAHLATDGVIVFDDYGQYADVRAAVDGLAGAGALSFWADVLGHAYTGVTPTPPPALAEVLTPFRGRGRLLFASRLRH